MEKRFEINGQKYSMVGGRLYTSNGEEIKDLRQKSVILSRINSKSGQPIGADNDTVKSSTVVDSQELPNIGETDGTQSGINSAVDTKIGSIDGSIDTIENDIITIKDDIANIDAKAYKIKGSKTAAEINELTDVAQGDVYNISYGGEITEGPDEQPFKVKKGDNIVRVQDTVVDPETEEEQTVYFWDKFTSGSIDFSAIDGQPTDNDNLKNALDAKQDVIADINEIRDNARYGLDFHNGTEYFAANADFGYLSPYKYSRYYDSDQGIFTGNQLAYIELEGNPVFYAGDYAVAISNKSDRGKIQISDGGTVYFILKENNQIVNNLVISPNAFQFNVDGSSQVYINQNGIYFFDFGSPVFVWDQTYSVFQTGHPRGFLCTAVEHVNSLTFMVNDNRGGVTFMSQSHSAGADNVSFMSAQKHNTISSLPNFVAGYTANDQSTYAKIAVHGNVAFQSQYNIDGSDLRATERSTDQTRTYKNSYQTLFYPNQKKMIHYGGFNSSNVAYGEKLYINSPDESKGIQISNTETLVVGDLKVNGGITSNGKNVQTESFGLIQGIQATFIGDFTIYTQNSNNDFVYLFDYNDSTNEKSNIIYGSTTYTTGYTSVGHAAQLALPQNTVITTDADPCIVWSVYSYVSPITITGELGSSITSGQRYYIFKNKQTNRVLHVGVFGNDWNEGEDPNKTYYNALGCANVLNIQFNDQDKFPLEIANAMFSVPGISSGSQFNSTIVENRALYGNRALTSVIKSGGGIDSIYMYFSDKSALGATWSFNKVD